MNSQENTQEKNTNANEQPVRTVEEIIAESREQLLRLKAEFDNTRKRLEKDTQEAVKFANEKIIAEIIPIADNFERALLSLAQGHDPAKVKDGLVIAKDELNKILKQNGVQVIQSVGMPFDPNLHEAVAVVEDGKAEDGTVVDEVQKGFMLNGRLIRPSRVRIAQSKSE